MACWAGLLDAAPPDRRVCAPGGARSGCAPCSSAAGRGCAGLRAQRQPLARSACAGRRNAAQHSAAQHAHGVLRYAMCVSTGTGTPEPRLRSKSARSRCRMDMPAAGIGSMRLLPPGRR